MKENKLGEFEEIVLLFVGILNEDAYALRITEEFAVQTNRSVTVGAVHATLSRMCDKGFLKSKMTEPSANRGGRRKRVYEITAFGEKGLKESRDLRLNLWNQYPGLSGKLGFNL